MEVRKNHRQNAVVCSSWVNLELTLQTTPSHTMPPTIRNIVTRNWEAVLEPYPYGGLVVELDLTSTGMRSRCAISLALALERNDMVRSLILEENKIGPSGAEAIARALQINSTVEELVLSSNNITDKGAIALAEMLKKNNTIKSLYIDYNGIGIKGASALAGALESNSTVTLLCLDGNKISDKHDRGVIWHGCQLARHPRGDGLTTRHKRLPDNESVLALCTKFHT